MPLIEGTYIKSIFDPDFEAPLELWNNFSKHLIQRNFKKNEIIKDINNSEKYIDIVISGSTGIFVWADKNLKCLDLFFEKDFSCDFMSFVENKSSELFTMALEATEVHSISKHDIEQLYFDNVPGLHIVRSAASALFVHKQKQQIEFMTRTAEQRFNLMIQERPEFIQRIASKHLASYLSITPESFSRIRKKYTQSQKLS